MKYRVTGTISHELEIELSEYEGSKIENAPKTEDEIAPFEIAALKEGDDWLTIGLLESGVITDVKIEKVEETAAPAASRAA